MKKSIFLFFAAILCAMSVQGAASKQFNDQQFLYCIVENTNWKSWGIKYNWYWDSGNWYATENGKKISENHWYAKVPNAYIGGVQFIRCSKDFASEWDWSVTKNSNTRTDNKINCAKITGSNWGNAAISWTTYAPPMSSVTLSDNGTVVNSGSGTEADPYIIEIGTTIKVKAEGTKAVEDPDATINYDFKQGSTSKQNGTGTTWTLTASDASTVYTINLDGYTKVNTTSSSTKTADALYFKTVADVSIPTYQVTVSANDDAMGTVTGAGEYNENATVTLKATANDGYRFVNWTIGGVEKETATTYSFTVTEAVEVVANFEVIPTTTVYFVNAEDWAGTINAYAWTDGSPKVENAGWPGVAAHKEDYQIEGHDVYSYTAEEGKYAKVIFNNNSGKQTDDLAWTAGQYICKNQWYATIADVEAALAAPIEYESVYFINTNDWAAVNIYTWTPEVGSWPGVAMTQEAEQIAGKDVYSYTVEKGTTFGGIKFNEGQDKAQTGDLTWQAGKYYAPSKGTWYADAAAAEAGLAPDPLATNVYLAGDMNEWNGSANEFKKATADATAASVTVNLTAKSYTFQLVINGTWYGNKSTMKRGGDAVHEGGWSFEDTSYGANCTIVADFPGDYTFTWNLETKKLTVTYPELPTYTVTATAENGTVTGAGEYKHGTEATLVATPNTGFAFVNWKKGEEVVSSEASYTFTVTANTDLVATFAPEVTHEVTVSYLCNSNPIPGHDAHTLAVGVTTPSTITAPAITHYTFDGWTLGTGVQAVDATANPIQITTLAEGEYTLTANYTKIELTYTVKVPEGTEKCYIAGDMNSWSFQEMTPTVNANEFTITIDGATTDHKYKYACGPDWAYVEKKEDGSELDADRTYNANDVVAKWAEPAKCYLMGIGGDWTTGIEMEEDGDQFKLLCQPIAEGEQFKFKYGDTWTTEVENYNANGVDWVESYPGSGQYNITLPAGNYDFYYKKNENKVWIGVCTPATPTPDYTREVPVGYYATLCLPNAISNYEGAEIYEVAWMEFKDDKAVGLYLDQVAADTKLVAGKPYIFKATAATQEFYYEGDAVLDPAAGKNGLRGTLNGIAAGGLTNHYIIADNKFWVATASNYLDANRAYIDATAVNKSEPALIPGRRRVSLGAAGENAETSVDNIITSDAPVKVIENGQLIIIRNGEKYNVQGVRL